MFACAFDPSCSKESIRTTCPAAIDCALAALVKGEPGTLRWRAGFSMGDDTNELHIVGDGSAFYARALFYDLGCDTPAVTRRSLRPAAVFAECQERLSAVDRLDCVRDALVGEPLETCESRALCGWIP